MIDRVFNRTHDLCLKTSSVKVGDLFTVHVGYVSNLNNKDR